MALKIHVYVIKRLNINKQGLSSPQEVVQHTGKTGTKEIKSLLANAFMVARSTERKRWAINLGRYLKRYKRLLGSSLNLRDYDAQVDEAMLLYEL
ncbi:hypothetical protein ACQKPX_23475 [Photobacterium sp. DNB23_23_1]